MISTRGQKWAEWEEWEKWAVWACQRVGDAQQKQLYVRIILRACGKKRKQKVDNRNCDAAATISILFKGDPPIHMLKSLK